MNDDDVPLAVHN